MDDRSSISLGLTLASNMPSPTFAPQPVPKDPAIAFLLSLIFPLQLRVLPPLAFAPGWDVGVRHFLSRRVRKIISGSEDIGQPGRRDVRRRWLKGLSRNRNHYHLCTPEEKRRELSARSGTAR